MKVAVLVGQFEVNRATAETNLFRHWRSVRRPLKSFRAQNKGHLVVISSMSALRGLPKHLSTHAASKAAVAHWQRAFVVELLNTPIKVSTIFQVIFGTELNEGAKKLPFEVDEKRVARLW